jgi:N-acetylglucosamine-6-sulfatase
VVAAATVISASTLVAASVVAGPCSPELAGSGPAGASATGGDGSAAARTGGRRPNVILIVTDDQRADTLRYMPNVKRLLAGHGVTFRRFYVTTSLCCPSRASILTGQYSRHTGVFDNVGPHGGAIAFDDHSSLATWLASGGYRTALVGKYLNGYTSLGRCYFPAGWSEWNAVSSEPEAQYFDYTINHDGVLVHRGSRPSDYSTSVFARTAARIVTSDREPFFVYLAPATPHRPATRLPRDQDRFATLPSFRPPSYDERDVSDKPWRGRVPPLSGDRMREIDGIRKHQLESLQALDRSVGALVEALRRAGRLSNTVIFYTSDNGFLWGEHRLVSKVWPYEESIRVPLVVRVPWLRRPRADDHLVLNIDLASTIADLAGVEPGLRQDGGSLLPLLRGRHPPWRSAFVEEWLGRPETDVGAPPPFEAIHTDRYVWVEYSNGWRELYDLRDDPFEQRNLAGTPSAADLAITLRTRLHRLLAPASAPA